MVINNYDRSAQDVDDISKNVDSVINKVLCDNTVNLNNIMITYKIGFTIRTSNCVIT